jgi:hypothetical protein
MASVGLAEAGVEGAEAVYRRGFASAVAELPVQGQGLVEVVGGGHVPAQSRLDVAEVGQHVGFAVAVAGLPVQGQSPAAPAVTSGSRHPHVFVPSCSA